MASTVPRLRGAVELLLTGEQHKPCASFNQQACKKTTSVAKASGKPRKKLHQNAQIKTKNGPHFGVQKRPPFWGLFLGNYFVKKNTNPEADPKTGQFLDPQNGGRFLF